MQAEHDKKRLATLTLAALGVVYGDIGTSPLYTIKEVFGGAHHPVPITPDNVLGILSLFFWSLIIVVTLKYVAFIMRADNKGEGGIMALMALALAQGDPGIAAQRLLIMLGLFGAALFYGDGVITPAISVLSAVEGLEADHAGLQALRHADDAGRFWSGCSCSSAAAPPGSARCSGRSCCSGSRCWRLWCGIAIVSTRRCWPRSIRSMPFIFCSINSLLGFFALGAVVLCSPAPRRCMPTWATSAPSRSSTPGSAMCCRRCCSTISARARCCWPTRPPSRIRSICWRRSGRCYPLVVLATLATVIASQAVISGAFSITQQAIQLGYTPRIEVQHTSDSEIGQIYLPAINWLLLVVDHRAGARLSAPRRNLAAAYGIAVTGTMLITNLLAIVVAVRLWSWSPLRAVLGALPFICIDLGFFLANSVKIPDGGWFPLAFGLAVFILLTTWKRGRELLHERLAAGCDATQAVHREHRRQRRRARARHRHLHDRRPRIGAARPAAQPQALQDAARAGGDPQCQRLRRALCAGYRPRRSASAGRKLLRRSSSSTASRTNRTCRLRSRCAPAG